ncbi:MAG: serine/threonine-protein kinase, partial [Acidobacteriota bacterium]|nr:serine/threonine-protein kinase [Acidobacteriota bacterium]
MTFTGTRFGQYQVVSMLGVGGMGEVYLAQDTGLKRLVALKLISTTLTANKDRLRRFKQEAQAIAALNHPNIITLYEIGQVDNSHYIATEFINGETLRQHIDSLRIDISQAVNIALQVAEALLAAHEAGIVHRDIKPDNIMVRPDGYVKVLDFGLAKLTEHNPQFYVGPEAPTASNIHTEPGTIIGTITYMSPEQLRGPLVDGRTDIWSLGVVLYEMVARCVPFTGSSKSDVIVSILEREQPPLTQYAPHAPTELQRIVNKALHKDKEHRFLTVKDLLLDIKNLKENLDFEAKLQRAAGPSQQRTNDGTSSDDGRAASVTGGTAVTTAAVVTARLTSSIEYLVSGLRRHQKGALILLFTLVVLGGTIAYQRSRPDPNAIIPVPSQGLKFTKLETISSVKEATISPDGKFVATVVEEGGKQSIAVRQVATARILQLVEPSEDLYSGLTFSPDGNYVLYLKQEADCQSLYQVSALGGASRKLIMNVSTPVTFAPSGKQLAFVRKRRDAATLILANREGTVERELATSAGPYVFSITRDLNNGPAWSPDGNVIACPVTS